MKLLLASQGFLTNEIAEEVRRVVNKNLNEINIAIVNESYLELDREKWDAEFLNRTLKNEKFPIYAINDNQMISYVDGEIRFIGGEPAVFGKKY